ncbi:MAG TPA: transmembrane transport protein [Thermoanaerobaculia bacterium]|jgi:hypothetical protein
MKKVSVEEMQRIVAGELSLRSRIAYAALLLVALLMAGGIASLLLTEEGLPRRTEIAFAVLIVIGLSWVAYAAWVLTRRRVLLAGHRIIAARMAIAFTSVFVVGAMLLAMWPAAIFGAVLLIVAVAMLLHARKRFAQLLQRRRELEAMQ